MFRFSLVPFFLLLFIFQANGQSKLLVSGDIRGEIEPCGCSKGDEMGGIKRTSSFIKQEKKKREKFLWIDTGNFSADSSDQGLLKSKMLVKNFSLLGLTAVLPGPREFQRGLLNLQEFSLPFVLTNSDADIPNVKSVVKKNDYLFYGYLSKSLLEAGTHKTKYLIPLSGFIEKVKKSLQTTEEYKVLIFRGSKKELSAIASESLFDLIIPANQVENEENQTLQFQRDQTNYSTAPLKGQGFLEIRFKDKKSTSKFIWLNNDITDDKSWNKDFKIYAEEVDQLFFKFIEQQEKSSYKTVYNGADSCIACHVKEGEIWQNSKHAHAWKTLEQVSRTNDPECIVCHSVGFKKGGFLSADLTPKLKNVQCENCHGITPKHLKGGSYSKSRVKLTQKVCKQCHIGSHSPNFDFNKYWPQIYHLSGVL